MYDHKWWSKKREKYTLRCISFHFIHFGYVSQRKIKWYCYIIIITFIFLILPLYIVRFKHELKGMLYFRMLVLPCWFTLLLHNFSLRVSKRKRKVHFSLQRGENHTFSSCQMESQANDKTAQVRRGEESQYFCIISVFQNVCFRIPTACMKAYNSLWYLAVLQASKVLN